MNTKADLKYSNRKNIKADKCETCNSTNNIERHRIIPGKLKGEYVEENVIALCDRCHKLAHKLIALMKKQHGIVEYENIPLMIKNYLNQIKE